ncbi:MAG: proton-conducting transporter membrane subunit [Tepidisphaeraceae bacterium]
MPMPALFLVLATLLPLAAFGLLLTIGKRMGDPLAGWVATAFAAGSFAFSMAGMIAWYEGGQLAGTTWGPGDKPIELTYKWLPLGPAISPDHPGFFDLNLHVDTLTVAMFNTITLVVALGHAFSARYMRNDKRFARFFVYLQLSYFSMLAFVLGANLLEILVFWYLIALSGYLLLTRLDDRPSGRFAIASFIVKRIGDAGFLVGMGILLHGLGNATVLQMDRWLWPATGAAIHLPSGAWISGKTLSVVGIALFCGAACRSALFPLHFWLPAARGAPIPAAAFVQSVTLTAAGLYLIGRFFPILTPTAKLSIATIGLLSLVVGALLALIQRDLGRVLAYSTVSQFGLMFMAIGIGSWVGGLFHLLTHAFFKSLLVLAAGSVIHAAHGEQDLNQFGGLMRKMPLAGVTFAIGLLAMAGAPFTCGYYSNQTILIHAGALASFHAMNQPLYRLFFIIPAAVSGLTALYMTRCWMLLFWGRPRNRQLHVTARERTGFWFPLFGLAVVSLIGGSRLLDIKQSITQGMIETDNYCNSVRDPAAGQFAAFAPAWTNSAEQASNNTPSVEDSGERLFNRYATWPFGVGIVLGFVFYCRRSPIKAT